MYPTLQDFLWALESTGQLVRVRESVSPLLEISEVSRRHALKPAAVLSQYAAAFDPDHATLGGKALLFENVEGCDFPVAINLFGSYHRMELALGCADDGGFEAIAGRIEQLIKPQPPRSISEAVAKARQLLPLLRVPPKLKRSGAAQQNVKLTKRGEVNLLRLPLIKCWPLDGDPQAVGYNMTAQQAGTAKGDGRYITFAGMHTIHADDRHAKKPASHNIGMYRAQLIDETRLAMHWHIHHDGAAHWRSWKRIGEPMPIAICLGGESVLPYAATCPLPPGISELLMAGFLNGRGLPLVQCRTVPLRVPANSEIIIEGYVSTECGDIGFDPADGEPLGPGAVFEGPFGDHTGFYSLPDRYPIMNVTAITHRDDAVFPAIIVGPPPQEDYYLGKATERIMLPLLRTIIPDIVDYHLPLFGCFHNCAFLQIDKQYPLQARRVMHAVWGAGQMAWTKWIVVVDSDVNVHDEQAVLEAIFRNCHFQRDVEVVNGPLDILDHAAPRLGAGHKIGFDATTAWAGEEVAGVSADAPLRSVDPDETRTQLKQIIGRSNITDISVPDFGHGRCAFIAINKEAAGQGAEAIELIWRDIAESPDFIIAVDATVDVQDWQQVFFHCCANMDPGRDRIVNSHRMGFDATSKQPGDARHGQPVRQYPPLLQMDATTIEKVSSRSMTFEVDEH